MATPYIGQIAAFGFNFAPYGWVLCQGQMLSIDEYSALFSLIGTTYGGDGVQTFGVPDLRGRASVNQGQAPGLSNWVLGEKLGTEQVTLNGPEMPQHTHTLMAVTTGNPQSSPANSVLGPGEFWSNLAPDSSTNQGSIQFAGGSQPHENRQPCLVVNFCMATEGLYPPRS